MEGKGGVRAAVVHEDDDPLVVAAARLCKPEDVYRRPGLLLFWLELPGSGRSLRVRRSRFDGDYGSVCCISVEDQASDSAAHTWAPVCEVVDALKAGEPVVSLAEVFKRWMTKKQTKG